MENAILKEVKEALKEYDIEVLSIKTESYKGKKGVWWIRTPEGYKILKKQSHSSEMLDFIIAAIEHLVSNGIFIPEINKTKNGNPYALINNTCYVLSEAIDGRTLDYLSSDNMKRIAHELAKFHKASKGFVPPAKSKIRTHLGDWIETYQKKMNKLKGYYDTESSKDKHSEFGKLILSEFPYFYERMETAIRGLDQSVYHQWVQTAQKEGALCHQDFAAGNLILDHSGRLYVLDTDSITLDLPHRDIRKILNKIMKKRGKWELTLVSDILKWYQEINPLDSSQWIVLKHLLTYPHLFEGIMSKYYERREKTWTEEKYLKRLQEMIHMDKLLAPMIDQFDRILPA